MTSVAHAGHARRLAEASEGRANNLDALRFFAASLVIFSHAYPLTGHNDEPLSRLSHGEVNLGSLAVAIFFILSGFLVTQSWERRRSVTAFACARMLRVFPALAVVTFGAVLLGRSFTSLPPDAYWGANETWDYLRTVLLFPMKFQLPGVFERNPLHAVNGALWTIPFEVACYGALLILGALGGLRREAFAFLVTLLLYVVFTENSAPLTQRDRLLGYELWDYLRLGTLFFVGSAAYLFRHHISLRLPYFLVAITICWIAVIFGAFFKVFAVFGAYAVLYVGYGAPPWLRNFGKYGDFSYGIYLTGFPVQQVFVATLPDHPPWFNFLVSWPIALALALLSWRFVERPSLSLHQRLRPLFEAERCLRGVILGAFGAERWTRTAPRFVFGATAALASFVLLTGLTSSPTEAVHFPWTGSEHALVGHWLPQTPDEGYRWVARDAGVRLQQLPHHAHVRVHGYLPETFREVTKARLLVDGREAGTAALEAGRAIEMQASLPPSSKPTLRTVTVLFDAIHEPEAGAADQRRMSALITRIALEPQ
jgi:peptidoglycan/LPS O-acetylase OafA/YrhL